MALNIPHALYDAVKEGTKIGKAKALEKKKPDPSIREYLLDTSIYKRLSKTAQKRLGNDLRVLLERQRMMAAYRGPKYFRVVTTFTVEATERFINGNPVLLGRTELIRYQAGRHLTLWPQPVEAGEEHPELFLHKWVDPDDWVIHDTKIITAVRRNLLRECDMV